MNKRIADINELERQSKHIAVIGDVILDHYLFGRYDRPSPEADVPVIEHVNEFYMLGGAANVAKNINSLGATPILFSVLGKDHYADIFYSLLAENNISDQFIIKNDDINTVCKTRLFVDDLHHLRYDREPRHLISPSIHESLFRKLSAYVVHNKLDMIILQDYNKGVLSESFIDQVLTLAHNASIPVVVDPKKDNFFSYKGVDIFKPNLREIEQALNVKINTEPLDVAALHETASFLKRKLNAKKLMITLGEHGLYYQEGNQFGIVPAKKVEVKDVCGAGDAVISTCALLQTFDLDLADIAELSNLAGSIVCSQLGVVAISWSGLVKV